MDWPQLAVLDASFNSFTGTIPEALYELPVLGYLNLANNRCAVSAWQAPSMRRCMCKQMSSHAALTPGST